MNNMLGREADVDFVTEHYDELNHFSDLAVSHWGYYHIVEATNDHDYTKPSSVRTGQNSTKTSYGKALFRGPFLLPLTKRTSGRKVPADIRQGCVRRFYCRSDTFPNIFCMPFQATALEGQFLPAMPLFRMGVRLGRAVQTAGSAAGSPSKRRERKREKGRTGGKFANLS